MIKRALAASMILIGVNASAHAATFSCSFQKDGAVVDDTCKLDSAGTADCQFEYASETPALIGFCYAYPADETGNKVWAGCGFGTAEADIAGITQQRRENMANRATPTALGAGFLALGDTIGVPDDVLVGFREGTGAAEFIAYCAAD